MTTKKKAKTVKKTAVKKSSQKKVCKKCKDRSTYKVSLTRNELIHLRDLFSVLLPPEMNQTLSERLALSQDRSLVESKLWSKLVELCKKSRVSLGEKAPDFVVAASSAPAISVFEVAHDPAQFDEQTLENVIDNDALKALYGEKE